MLNLLRKREQAGESAPAQGSKRTKCFKYTKGHKFLSNLQCHKKLGTQEITLGYLEQTHIPEENYAQRIRRRKAFLAGRNAGSVVLVPGGVSQATACDGILYQIPAENNAPNATP